MYNGTKLLYISALGNTPTPYYMIALSDKLCTSSSPNYMVKNIFFYVGYILWLTLISRLYNMAFVFAFTIPHYVTNTAWVNGSICPYGFNTKSIDSCQMTHSLDVKGTEGVV